MHKKVQLYTFLTLFTTKNVPLFSLSSHCLKYTLPEQRGKAHFLHFLLNSIIKELQGLDGFQSSLIYVSDHGESLGENGVYMHGIPLAFAPKEQYEIPFLVWSSEANKIKNLQELSHFYVFHSVLAFLGVKSEVFDENLNLFK